MKKVYCRKGDIRCKYYYDSDGLLPELDGCNHPENLRGENHLGYRQTKMKAGDINNLLDCGWFVWDGITRKEAVTFDLIESLFMYWCGDYESGSHSDIEEAALRGEIEKDGQAYERLFAEYITNRVAKNGIFAIFNFVKWLNDRMGYTL